MKNKHLLAKMTTQNKTVTIRRLQALLYLSLICNGIGFLLLLILFVKEVF